MIKKVLASFAVILCVFLVAVSFRSPDFRYERSGLIQAPPDVIYPYISDLSKNGDWSPFEKADPAMKKTLSGSVLTFESDKAGNGSLEITRATAPNEVDLRLRMTKPFAADNLVEYRLTPEPTGTRFTWTMSGRNGYVGKLIATLIDCDGMIGGQFEEGIANLKRLVEK